MDFYRVNRKSKILINGWFLAFEVKRFNLLTDQPTLSNNKTYFYCSITPREYVL